MELWKGKVRVEGLEMVASVQISLPTSNKLGKWHGSGISEKSWENLTRNNLIETNIGTIKILKQVSDPGGIFSIEFKGIGIPEGPLAKEIEDRVKSSK